MSEKTKCFLDPGDDDDPEVVLPSLKEMIKMCRIIEKNGVVVCAERALEVVKILRRYRGHLSKEDHCRYLL